MNTHQPYEEKRKQPEDFKVKYHFLKRDDDSYIQLPFQGMRCDFSYEGDDIQETGIYMIWPEFQDQNGDVIINKEAEIPKNGIARMWIVAPEMREKIHRSKAKKGTKGFFMVGSKQIATVEIIELVGLHTNAN